MIETLPETQERLSTGTVPPRHYVENVAFGEGKPTDPFNPAQQTLCGKPWDRLNVQHNGSICQACVDELRRRHSK